MVSTSYGFYNYPEYWQGRKYEDQAEKHIINNFFKEIPKNNFLIDIGAGYGRLTETYVKRFKKCVLLEPSAKLINQARRKFEKFSRVEFKQGTAQKLPFKDNLFDTALMVRVSHHLTDLPQVLTEAKRILKPNGYLIFEFANKINFKSSIIALLEGHLPSQIVSHLPKNLSSDRKTAFFNYHPTHIKSLLLTNGFKIVKTRSVSNFRHWVFKKLIPLKILLWLDSTFSTLTAQIIPFYGPSIFILAQKNS